MYLPFGNFSWGLEGSISVLTNLPAFIASPSQFMIKDLLCLLFMEKLSLEDLLNENGRDQRKVHTIHMKP